MAGALSMVRISLTCVAVSTLSWLLVVASGCDAKLHGACATDRDCPPPQLCSAGRCVPPGPVAEGEPCDRSTDCSTGACRDLGAGAVCVLRCSAAADCGAARLCLPTATVTATADGTLAGLELLCVARAGGDRFVGEACATDDGCLSGLCYEGQCTQPCGACPAEWSCAPATIERDGLALDAALCRREPLLEVQELGALTTTAEGVATVSFAIDQGVGSFVVIADDRDDLAVSIERLDAPDGTRLFDVDDPGGALVAPYYGVGTATVLVPGTDRPAGRAQPGTHVLALATHDPSGVPPPRVAGAIERVAVVTRRGGGRGGLLDLNLHFAPGTGITAAEAPDDPFLTAALQRLQALYWTLMGVGLGELRYFDLPAGTDVVETLERGREIFAAHSRPGPNALSVNVFVVSDVSFAGGFAGAVPGPPGLFGRPGSGVMVRRYSAANTFGALIAHEIGHYLGLWHTSEPEGWEDPISDTPVCAPGTPEKDCPDYRNLMYPVFPTTDPVELTPGQAAVVRGSPWTYEVRLPNVCGEGVPAVDLGARGRASGDLGESGPSLSGSCGGAGPGARAHLLRVEQDDLESLELTVTAWGAAPVVHVRRGGCADDAPELDCARGVDREPLTLRLERPAPGAYVVVVGAEGGSGRYNLRATRIRAAAP